MICKCQLVKTQGWGVFSLILRNQRKLLGRSLDPLKAFDTLIILSCVVNINTMVFMGKRMIGSQVTLSIATNWSLLIVEILVIIVLYVVYR